MNWEGFRLLKKENLSWVPSGVGATEEAKIKQTGLCFGGAYGLKKTHL